MSNKFKKGQIGETTTWLVATILIVVILLFFIFGSSLLATTKSLKPFKEALFSDSGIGSEDIILKKSIITYYAIQEKSIKRKIDFKLIELEKEGEFNLKVNETKIKIQRGLNQ